MISTNKLSGYATSFTIQRDDLAVQYLTAYIQGTQKRILKYRQRTGKTITNTTYIVYRPVTQKFIMRVVYAKYHRVKSYDRL